MRKVSYQTWVSESVEKVVQCRRKMLKLCKIHKKRSYVSIYLFTCIHIHEYYVCCLEHSSGIYIYIWLWCLLVLLIIISVLPTTILLFCWETACVNNLSCSPLFSDRRKLLWGSFQPRMTWWSIYIVWKVNS